MEGIRNVNHEEEKAIEEFKKRVKDDLTPAMREDTTIYYRFLKARDFDIEKAEKMLRKHIIWRRRHQVDTITQNFKPCEFFVKMAAPSFISCDKDGDLVLYSPAGTFNIFEIYKSLKLNDLMKHLIWYIEKKVAFLDENNKKTGNYGYQATLILDLDKLTFRSATSNLTLKLFLRFVQMYQDNYPERLKWVYITNAPNYYVYVYSMLKSVMASNTVKKIQIYNTEGWKKNLLDLVDADALPAFLGGNRTDPDGNPRCRTFISPGGKIPEIYYLTNNDRYFHSDSQVMEITLSNQEKKKIRVDIEEVGLLLEWKFLSRNKDIGFGVLFQDAESNIQEVIPVERYDTSDGTEENSYKCHSAGTYIIIFDNTYSWLSSKKVAYSVNVRKPIV